MRIELDAGVFGHSGGGECAIEFARGGAELACRWPVGDEGPPHGHA